MITVTGTCDSSHQAGFLLAKNEITSFSFNGLRTSPIPAYHSHRGVEKRSESAGSGHFDRRSLVDGSEALPDSLHPDW